LSKAKAKAYQHSPRHCMPPSSSCHGRGTDEDYSSPPHGGKAYKLNKKYLDVKEKYFKEKNTEWRVHRTQR
jgi:hypothetical protein